MRKKLARPMTQKRLKRFVSYNPKSGKFYSRDSHKVLGTPNSEGYLLVQLGVKHYALHRLAWLYVYGKYPEGVIDHLDHNKKNNAIENLRDISQLENCKNQKLQTNNTSGFTGVHWHKRRKKWIADIKIDNKKKHLGCFDSIEEAVEVRRIANEKYNFHENHGKPLDNN